MKFLNLFYYMQRSGESFAGVRLKDDTYSMGEKRLRAFVAFGFEAERTPTRPLDILIRYSARPSRHRGTVSHP